MAQPAATIDITDLPELRRIVDEVRATRQPRVLRADDVDVAVLTPLVTGEGSEQARERSDDEIFLSSFGGWAGLVDTEQLKADLKAARGSDRPPVEFDSVTYLIDTDWVVDALVGTAAARLLLTSLRRDGIAISIVTYVEVFEGILGGRDPLQAEQTFRAFLHGTAVLGITEAVAERAAAIRVDLRRRRRQVTHRAMDILVAAAAIDHGLILVSRDIADYADIQGLHLYQPT